MLRQLAERIDLALSEEVERIVEGHSVGRTKRDVNRLDEQYFRLRMQLDAILTTAGVDGRPMTRTDSIEELVNRRRSRSRVGKGASGGSGGASTTGDTSIDHRSNTFNPNNRGHSDPQSTFDLPPSNVSI